MSLLEAFFGNRVEARKIHVHNVDLVVVMLQVLVSLNFGSGCLSSGLLRVEYTASRPLFKLDTPSTKPRH